MQEDARHRWQFPALGTLVTITLAGPSPGAECWDALEREVHQFARAAWPWADGELARFNAALAAGRAAAVPASLATLFEAAWRWRRRSSGAFEPRIAGLIETWGFDRIEHLRTEPPPPAVIEAARAALRAAPDWDGGPSHPAAPGIGWDFGAIGKGWIAARLLDRFADWGVDDALIDLGGHLAARGRCGARPWQVGIRDPRSPALAPALLATLTLTDAAVATHGDDQRGFDHGGRRYGHLLDPATGWPAQGLRALTVVDPDGVAADAGGAALFVAGPGRWPALARQLGLTAVLAVDAEGRLTATEPLAARLALAEGQRLTVV